MIQTAFEQKNGRFYHFRISGHAGFAEKGQDIVCAAVSSAVQLTANLITETFQEKADVSVSENGISIRLKQSSENGSALLNGLYQHLTYLAEDYPDTIIIQILEV